MLAPSCELQVVHRKRGEHVPQFGHFEHAHRASLLLEHDGLDQAPVHRAPLLALHRCQIAAKSDPISRRIATPVAVADLSVGRLAFLMEGAVGKWPARATVKSLA